MVLDGGGGIWGQGVRGGDAADEKQGVRGGDAEDVKQGVRGSDAEDVKREGFKNKQQLKWKEYCT